MQYSKNVLENKVAILDPGVYEVEIQSMSSKTGKSEKTGKAWEKTVFVTEVASPEAQAGQKFIFSLFSNQYPLILDMLHALGKKDEDIYDKSEQVSEEKLKELLEGQFVTLRVGLKNGYNEVIEVLKDEKQRDDKLEV